MYKIHFSRTQSIVATTGLVILTFITTIWLFANNGSVYYSYLPEQLQNVTTISSTNVIPLVEETIHELTVNNRKYAVKDDGGELIVGNNVEGEIIHERYYAAVTSFNSLTDSISQEELTEVFTTGRTVGAFKQVRLAGLDKQEAHFLFGKEVSGEVLDSITELRKTITNETIAIVPFDRLTPDLKVLKIDTMNILDADFTASEWPLKVFVTVAGKDADAFIAELSISLPRTNRPTDRMASLILTGVTAISRGVEYEIERRNDPLFPARGVMDVLSKADITHIDHENPLFDSCKPEREGIVLCGKTRSMESIKAIGTDIADLTGNHQNDYGPAKNLESIGHLEAAGIEYFAGGKNEDDARKLLIKEVKSTTFGFTGYNYFDSLNGPKYVSLANGDRPGANYYTEEKMIQAVNDARGKAEIVQVDYQFIETYQYEPIAQQVEVFRKTIDAGADIVVGVQSHQPQRIEFYKHGVIFYGLGNLFFDQMWSLPTRQGVIPRLTFIEGELVSIELLTTLLHDYAQPRFVEGQDRIDILSKILPKQTYTERTE